MIASELYSDTLAPISWIANQRKDLAWIREEMEYIEDSIELTDIKEFIVKKQRRLDDFIEFAVEEYGLTNEMIL